MNTKDKTDSNNPPRPNEAVCVTIVSLQILGTMERMEEREKGKHG